MFIYIHNIYIYIYICMYVYKYLPKLSGSVSHNSNSAGVKRK